ncbi:MAG: hypothetical protein J6J36_01595 [Clostridia bacterium]|nr:hypothetical protein [Clostridia bacterium]
MKKFVSIVSILALTICLMFTLSGCGSNKDSEKNEGTNTSSSEAKKENQDAKVFEYIEKIESKNTVEEINGIVGSEGELVDEKLNKYTWKISEDTSITATYYSGTNATISISCKDDLIKSSNVDFSKYSEIKAALNSSSLTYDEFIEKLGNVQGHMVEKSSTSRAYKWVGEDGRYLRATFSNSSNKCTFVSGRI